MKISSDFFKKVEDKLEKNKQIQKESPKINFNSLSLENINRITSQTLGKSKCK